MGDRALALAPASATERRSTHCHQGSAAPSFWDMEPLARKETAAERRAVLKVILVAVLVLMLVLLVWFAGGMAYTFFPGNGPHALSTAALDECGGPYP